MTRYGIYGIGHAILDSEVQVSDSELAELGFEKGQMTLVSEADFKKLRSTVHDTPINRCGGSAANTIITAQHLGVPSYLSCKVGDDKEGDIYALDLRQSGVVTRLDPDTRSGITASCWVMITGDAERTMATYLGVAGDLSMSDLDLDALHHADYLYLEGYLVSSPQALKTIQAVRGLATDAKLVLSFSDPAMATHFRDQLASLLVQPAHLLFCNEEEALQFTQKKTLSDAIEALKLFADTFVVTQGSKGATIWDGKGLITIAAGQVVAKDSTGAGDCFAGAFLAALYHGRSYRAAGEEACLAASQLVTQFGARLSVAEIRSLLDVKVKT